MYENLPTVFLNWEEMASKLRGDKFSGYIVVSSDTKTGIILFIDGRISGSLFHNVSLPTVRGQEALSKTTVTIQERKGNLSIYGTSNDICSLVEWFIDGHAAYSPMEAFFIDYDKFLTVLGEKNYTGLVSVSNDDFAHFIYISDGKVKGHFVDSQSELSDDSGALKDKLVQKGTRIEVFTKIDTSKQVKLEQPPTATPKPEVTSPPFEPPKPVTPTVTPVASMEPTKPVMEAPKVVEPVKPAEPIKVQPITPTVKPGTRPVINIPEDEVPDPFSMKKPETPKPEAPPKEDPLAFTPPVTKPQKDPTSFGGPSSTVVTPPSGKVAFLIDGIRKVAQSNIGEDMLPWLDGQISRMKAINPTLSKRDLMLLVDEIERYVRTVRQNPTKATKLSSQLRHIIESFASDLE
jgi:hypothetical protein